MNITTKRLIEFKKKIKENLNNTNLMRNELIDAIDAEFDELLIELSDTPVQTTFPRSEPYPTPLERGPSTTDRTSILKKTTPYQSPNIPPFPRQDFELPQVWCVSTCTNTKD